MRDTQYLTNCDYSNSERSGDYMLANEALYMFEACDDSHDIGNGNLCGMLAFDKETKVARFFSDTLGYGNTSVVGFYKAIPSALLMYRLACIFPGKIDSLGKEGYKFVWQFNLKHKETGERVCFGEWKGGSLFWTKFMGIKDCPPALIRDLERLLTILVSDNCPHPYDGLVAGGVA